MIGDPAVPGVDPPYTNKDKPCRKLSSNAVEQAAPELVMLKPERGKETVCHLSAVSKEPEAIQGSHT